ncbi:MAG: hypothetical protein NTW87_14120, partial [Planctomycetota bacterium]|nr:hypothetical protein [Planctomycetota bacterium]
PVARPAAKAAPQPAAQEEEGGDLFEPSIIGNVGAEVAAAQAQARAAGRGAPAAREPEEFEGTMYGPQVARQLVKAIREEKAEAETGSKARSDAPKVVVTTSGGPKPPSMFWLKFKTLVFCLFLVGACVVVWFVSRPDPRRVALEEGVKQLKIAADEFVQKYEKRPEHDLKEEMGILDEMRKKGEGYASECKDVKIAELSSQTLRRTQGHIAFLNFERALKAAVDRDDLAAAERRVAEMTATCDAEQKGVMKLASVAGAYEVFRHKCDSPPERAKKVPLRKDVEDLMACDQDLKTEYTDHGKSLGQYILFSRLADNAINLSRTLVVQWRKFYEDYDKNKASGTLDALKSIYPNLDDLIKDPNLK